MGNSDGGNETIGDVGKITKLSQGRLSGGVTVDGQAKIKRIGDNEASGAQLLPGQAIVAGEPGKGVAGALQTEPGIGIIDAQIAGVAAVGTGDGECLEKAAVHAGGGKHSGEAAVAEMCFARHQSGLSERIGLGKSVEPNGNIKVSGNELPGKLERIRVRTDRTAASPSHIVTVNVTKYATCRCGAADVLGRVGPGEEADNGVGRNDVWNAGTVGDAIKNEDVIASGNE